MFFYAFCFETEMTFIIIVYDFSLGGKSKFKQKKNAIRRLFDFDTKKMLRSALSTSFIECSVLYYSDMKYKKRSEMERTLQNILNSESRKRQNASIQSKGKGQRG